MFKGVWVPDLAHALARAGQHGHRRLAQPFSISQ